MAEITLQINTSGAWKNVMTFAPGRRAEVLRGLRLFAGILGPSAKWCLLREDGSREWLPGDLGPWRPITDEQPLPLQDVLVSVYHRGAQPMVFAAYRRGAEEWVISGTDHERVVGEVYAWAPCLDPAKRPAQQVAT
jgi:hypothetical protein